MFISVVVAVRDEIQYIEKCVTSLFNQTFEGKYEVIVVDGMSTDGTYEALRTLQKKYHFKLKKNPRINAAAGRNIGIENAEGDYIAFIDGDAIAAHDWLEQIKSAFERSEAAGVGGPDLLPEDSSETAKMIGLVMTSPLASGGSLNPSTQHTMMEEERWVEHIPTVNLSLKREVFGRVGTFDECFVKGQDLELSYRIVQAGYKLFYSPKIKVVHYRKRRITDFAKQIYKWAKAKVAIIKKHGIHGITRHVYLWPTYALAIFLLFLFLAILFNLENLFFILLTSVVFFYAVTILFESLILSKKYKNARLFLYASFLIPVVHIAYACGVLSALPRRMIWCNT